MKKLVSFTLFFLFFIDLISPNAQVIWEKLKNPAYPDSATTSDFKIVRNNFWLASTYDFGLFSSSDQGNTWDRIFYLDYYVRSIEVNSKNEIFIDCLYNFYRSTDEGMNWYLIPKDTINGQPGLLQLSYNDDLYGTFSSINKTHYITKLDSLDHWQIVGTFAPGLNSSPTINELLVDKFNDAYLSTYAISVPYIESFTYKALNDFSNFQQIFNTVSTFACNDSGYVFFGNTKMYRSSDRGLTFEEISNGISNLGVRSIKVINNMELYVGSVFDLYHSTNNGITWHYINGPADIVGVHSIEEISAGYLVIASAQGIYKNITVLDAEDNSAKVNSVKLFALSQNYPNPFNPSTKISWQSPIGSWQTLKVFDVLGNEVTTLVNEYKPSGSYEMQFTASGLVSGLYFYQLKAGNYSETKKMILIK